MRAVPGRTNPRAAALGADGGAGGSRPHLRVVAGCDKPGVPFADGEDRVLIGPIGESSPSLATRLRLVLQCVVDDDWSRGRRRVVEVDLTADAICSPGVVAVLAEARAELRAMGGHLEAICRPSRTAPRT